MKSLRVPLFFVGRGLPCGLSGSPLVCYGLSPRAFGCFRVFPQIAGFAPDGFPSGGPQLNPLNKPAPYGPPLSGSTEL